MKPGGHRAAGRDDRPAQDQGAELPVSTREDHIAPWKCTYRATQIYGGPVRFVLAASGHIAGVVNPPDSGKYSHWVNETLPPDPEDWFKGATELAGSWWPDWQRWVTAADKAKDQVPAPACRGDRQAAGARRMRRAAM